MFNFFKKRTLLLAPIDGRVMELGNVPDQVFAQRLAGDGVAIDSTGDVAVAPCEGILTLIFKTNHAYGITLDNGVELLVHIGVDTVDLKGEGFERIASEGQRVKAGDPIIKIDREKIQSKGFSLITPVLITDMNRVSELKTNTGAEVQAGRDEILSFREK